MLPSHLPYDITLSHHDNTCCLLHMINFYELNKSWWCSAMISVFNSLCPSDGIRHWKSLPTLVKVMAWCLMAPSHYLNQNWLTTNRILWHSYQGNIYSRYHPKLCLKFNIEITATSARGQWVKSRLCHRCALIPNNKTPYTHNMEACNENTYLTKDRNCVGYNLAAL